MNARELGALKAQLEHLLRRLDMARQDAQDAANELHAIEMDLTRLIDFTLIKGARVVPREDA